MPYTFFNDNNNVAFNINSYNENIKKKREDLDQRLNNLYKNRQVKNEIHNKHLNSNIYANILLTVLGTSLLYFTFIK